MGDLFQPDQTYFTIPIPYSLS